MDFIINHQGKSYTFKPNSYVTSNRLSLAKIQKGNKIIFDANRNFLNLKEERVTPEVPEIVLAKAKNELKSNIKTDVSLINHEFSHNHRNLEVVNFDSVAGAVIWESMVNAEDTTTTAEDDGGKTWDEDAASFYCAGAIECYLSHVDLTTITIINNKTKVKVVLDISDWTVAIHQIWDNS
ncbi:hypothetical protein OTK49_03510 [Vibrio coralliirubri]|uniref:hypothetical protein n=1 Tax=Vibrio coralliirubri TaxID=1516159 RepID=UPI002284A50A|nr:hypothetical protein [Vibrio coralliirubri]MCY9861585.1 hypothetical protein [Vibrio coralliirubri]